MLAEFSFVKLTHDLREFHLKKGAIGTIVDIYEGGKAYEVDFVDKITGEKIALLTLEPSEISLYEVTRSSLPTEEYDYLRRDFFRTRKI